MKKKESSMKKPISFEVSINQLEETVEKIEQGELSLEQSISEFEKGVRLIKNCQDYLKKAEDRVDDLLNEKIKLD